MRKISKVAVYGAGTMGAYIAQAFATHGLSVNLYSRSQKTLDTALSIMKTNIELLVEENMLPASELEDAFKRITCTTSMEDCAKDADMILETIIEKHDPKRELFALLDEICPEDVIFASDTSGINIFELIPARRQPYSIIAHYFSPAHLIPLVELVKGPETKGEVVESLREMYIEMGKTPVVVEKMLPGFVVNRFQRAMAAEADYLLDNGFITADQLDLALKSSILFRGVILGIIQRIDFSGVDSTVTIGRTTPVSTPPSEKKTITALYDAGHFGVKTGKGFYDYSGRKMEDVLRERDRRLIRLWEVAKDFIKNPV